jgi:hypothetical protein
MTTAQQRAHDLDELTAMDPGMNLFQWDLRYPSATEVTGFREPISGGGLEDNVDGPTAVPGEYSIVLDYGGRKMHASFTIALDPRLHPADDALAARLALAQQIHSTLDDLDKAINVALAARAHSSPHTRAILDAEIAKLVRLDIQSSEGDVLHETKLRDHLAYLAAQLDLSYDKPTAAQYTIYDELHNEATVAEARLQASMSPR